jgi:hypothetical protein
LHFDSPRLAEVFRTIAGWPVTDDLRSLFDEKVSDVAEAAEAKYGELMFVEAKR